MAQIATSEPDRVLRRPLSHTTASVGGCCTKPSAKTSAALAVTVAERARSAEAEQSAPRASHDLRLFRPHP
jgi:hypothetical protein